MRLGHTTDTSGSRKESTREAKPDGLGEPQKPNAKGKKSDTIKLKRVHIQETPLRKGEPREMGRAVL